MKKILRLLSEPRRKRLASAAVMNQAEFLNALAGNAQLHRWLRGQRTFQYFKNRYDLYADLQSKILGEESIDYLEFGVRYGDSLFKWSTIDINPDSRFFGFDSFEGIPEVWASVTGEAPKGSFSVGGVVPPNRRRPHTLCKGLVQRYVATVPARIQSPLKAGYP